MFSTQNCRQGIFGLQIYGSILSKDYCALDSEIVVSSEGAYFEGQHKLNKARVLFLKLALIPMYKNGLKKLLMKNVKANTSITDIAGSCVGGLIVTKTLVMYGVFADNRNTIVTVASIFVV